MYRDIDGRYCQTMAASRTLHVTDCQQAFRPAERNRLRGIDESRARFIDGTVVAAAQKVAITTSDGVTVRTRVIPPPSGLDAHVGFFAAHIRCGAVVSVEGLSAGGRVVAKSTFPDAASIVLTRTSALHQRIIARKVQPRSPRIG